MAPKRKRPERLSVEGGRSSPHRPGDTPLGQHDRDDNSGRGRGRSHRGMGRRDSSQNLGRNHPSHQQNHPHNHSQNYQSNALPSQHRSSSSSRQPPPPPPPQPFKAVAPTAAPALTPVPTPQPAVRPVSPVRSNYRYDNLTDEKISTWAEHSRDEMVQHGKQSREDVDITELSSLFQEFIHAVVEDRLNPADAGACVKEMIGDETSEMIKDSYAFAPHTLFLDSLSIVMENEPTIYRPSLRDFLIATGVSPALMRQVLDAQVLQQLGLIRENFHKFGIKQATNLLYRQANYNLLREETEGYSKLITELFTTSSVNPPPLELAEQTFERVKALIGTFDLDVGRVLDVTLDVAAAVLIKQFKFFVKFLRVSSWWPRSHLKFSAAVFTGGLPLWATPGYLYWVTTDEDEEITLEKKRVRDTAFWERAREIHLGAFFELGGRQVADSDSRQLTITNGAEGEDAVAELERRWVEETKTLPPPGNRTAAQLLGFKLRFYNSDAREESDVLPANLLYLAALLIKIGFISLADLYPHLSPADEDMEKVREKEMKKVEEKERASRGGTMNALLMAGVLPQGDDDNPISAPSRRELPKKAESEQKETPADAADSKSKLPEPLEQKVSLLIQLLTIGALPESLFILGRFPWITDASPEVLDRIHRILHYSVNKVFHDSRPVPASDSECPTKPVPDLDQTGLPKGSVRLSRLGIRKSLRWPFPDKSDTNETQHYRYYWDEWADNIPICQTVDDIFTLCGTLLNISGVNIGKDEVLLTKLARIGAKSLGDDTSAANLTRWHELLRRLLLPALSHTKANAAVVNAIWDLVSHYPITTRYSMYAEWFEGQTSRLPSMKAAFARATSETRGTMKRVSLTNLSEMAKQLAKTSYSSPGIVFRVAFEQLESYPNLIDAFVECAKYFTDLSYDVLVWSLMSSLGKSRSRTQADHALTTSKWLQALSRFSGRVFRRYTILNATPVLQYVNNQLQKGNSTDLIILKELIASMGGIVDSVDFTDYQVFSMAGGQYLQRHTLIRGQDKRYDSVKSSKRLIQALTDSKLASQFLINLAQYRLAALYQVPEDEAHIKYLSSMIDDSHQILIKYLDLLWSNLEPAAFDAVVPSITELMRSYGLDTSLAFLIGRSSLAHRMFPWKTKRVEEKEKTQPSQTTADKDGDVAMCDTKTTGGDSFTVETTTTDEQVGAQNAPALDSTTNQKQSQKPDDSSMIKAALQPIVDSIQDSVRPEAWQKITPELYVTFWALQLGDLYCPDKMYRQEKDKLKSEEIAISRDRSDMSRRGQERKMEKRKELMQLQIGLSEECGEHLLRQGKWKFFLSKQFQSSFPEPRAKPDAISDILLEQCFIPRMLLSTADAEYTYRFIKALHEWNAPGFKLMSLYDRLFNANRLRSLIFTATVMEAEYLGRFLKLILEDLSRWHKNAPVPNEKDTKASRDQPRLGAFEKEGKGPSEQPRLGFSLTVDGSGKPLTFVEHAQFKDMLFRWHKNLNMALRSCLEGSEWMHIRNAISVLKSVLDFFPAIDFMATKFSSLLQTITKQESSAKPSADSEIGGRVDLSVAAQGAMSELQRRKSKWVMVQAFRPGSVGASQSDEKPTNLRAAAAEFRPSTRTPGAKQTTNEEEDGEVKDGKDSRSPAPDSMSKANPHGPKDTLPAKPAGLSRDTPNRDSSTSGQGRNSASNSGPGAGFNGPKGDSRPNTLPDRLPHSLPNRPNVPIPTHANSERFNAPRGHERRDGKERESRPRDSREPREPREGRDPREPRDGRDNRESRDGRELRDARQFDPNRPRDFPDRRPADQVRDPMRPDMPARRNEHERDRPRDGRSGRTHEPSHGRLNDSPALSTTQTASAEAAEPIMNPERAALFAHDGPDRPRASDSDRTSRGRRPTSANDSVEAVNPERAALIEEKDNTPSRAPREERERNPRGQSPRRGGRYVQENAPSASGRENRQDRSYPPEHRQAGRDPRERSPMPGSFRGEKPIDREGERGLPPKGRDASGFHGPSRGLEGDYKALHQDHSYGRLNAIQSVADIPFGPRGRGRGVSRGGHGGPPNLPGRLENRFSGPDSERPPTPERPPPTGPSSGRGRRGAFEPNTGPATPSGTPSGHSHSDRSRNAGSGPSAPSPATTTATPTDVHPSRLAQIGGSVPPPPPPPGPPPHVHGRQPMQGTNTPDRGSGPGPRQTPGSYSGSPAGESVVPTGPSSNNERSRTGNNSRRQLAGIQSTLQANVPELGRSNSTRRNQQRPTLGGSDAQVLTGGSPVATPTQERQDPARHDSSSRGPQNGDEVSGRSDHERSRRESRSNRPSRRSSRERDRDRSPGREREGKEHREYRDRRSAAADGGRTEGGREERESRRSNRDQTTAPRESMGPPPTAGGRDMGPGRESRHRNEGQGPRGGEEWGNNRGGRGGPRDAGQREGGPRQEERREGREDRGRKRRSEDGGALSSEREKRARR
ncbi:transcription factor/nuclear export subunit protein 2-domain-containing protein [Dactylonectria estremocensis]|uniref:THO complex subunit 2 n=1 Tax=Dactylonectria estremocensis TaxID=1079267 RepID=A0A9P9FDF6_9HYPO|nr:transcription factor/nuclear export subunit protein 2-domain-containing protein [Dactylonectria estremocensis]